MKQQTLAMQRGFKKFGRKSKREVFLEEMDRIVPWSGLVELIEPHYPKGGTRSSACRSGADVASLLSAAAVQLIRPRA
jgi:hypothetical protein